MARRDRISWVDSVRLPTAFSDIALCVLFYALARLDRTLIPALLPILGTWIGYRFGSRSTKRVMEATERAAASMRPPPLPPFKGYDSGSTGGNDDG